MSARGNFLRLADAVLKTADGDAMGGFNSRIFGYSFLETMANCCHGPTYARRDAGFRLADSMVSQGKLYAVHNFHHSHECSGHAFPYGGKFVCETCTWPGMNTLEKPWWTIKCYPDGDAWCCVGPDFEDLQTSDNFAFGETRDAAIKAYGDLMVARAALSRATA